VAPGSAYVTGPLQRPRCPKAGRGVRPDRGAGRQV